MIFSESSFGIKTIEPDRYLKEWGFYGDETIEIIGSIHDTNGIEKLTKSHTRF